jgi:hypothetical protein
VEVDVEVVEVDVDVVDVVLVVVVFGPTYKLKQY